MYILVRGRREGETERREEREEREEGCREGEGKEVIRS